MATSKNSVDYQFQKSIFATCWNVQTNKAYTVFQPVSEKNIRLYMNYNYCDYRLWIIKVAPTNKQTWTSTFQTPSVCHIKEICLVFYQTGIFLYLNRLA